MGNEQQSAGFPRILLTKTLIVQRGDDRFAGARRGNKQIARIAADRTLGLQLIQNLLLIRVGLDIHGIDFGVVAVEILFRLQCAGQTFPLPLIVVLKFLIIPVKLKGGGHLVDGLRQIFPRDLGIPLQPTGQRRVREVGGSDIGRGKAGVTAENIRLRMEPGDLGVVADLDLCVGELAQFFDSLHVGGTHVGCGNDPQLTAVLREGSQFIHDETQTAPLDEGHQYVDPIAGQDLFFELRVHLRFVDSASEQAGLRDGGLRPDDLSPVIDCPNAVFSVKKSKKLFRPLCNRERIEVSFSRFRLDGGDNLIGKSDLGVQITAIIPKVVQPALHYLSHVLCQHFGRLGGINGRSLTELVICGKLAV